MNRSFTVLLCVVGVSVSAFASPTGRFRKSEGTTYSDIVFSSDGKTATWHSKACRECEEKSFPPEPVQMLGGNLIRIGTLQFELANGQAILFHPSMGEWRKQDGK